MRKLSTHAVGIAQGDAVLFSDFEHDGEMWTGEGPRLKRHAIRFDEPFRQPPAITVSVSMLDISNGANTRFDVQAEKIGRQGFEIVFRTWGDSRVARARVAWQAIGPVSGEEDWEL